MKPPSNTHTTRRRLTQLSGAPAALWAPSNELIADYGYLALGLLGVFLLLLFLRARNHRGESSSPLENPSFIQAVLTAAAEQRVRVDVICPLQEKNLSPLVGRFLPQQDKDKIYIATNNNAVDSTWKDTPVNVFFSFTSRGERTFYHFASTMRELRQHNGHGALALARPTLMTNNQRREFARITPEADMVAAVALWPGQADQELPEGMQVLGRPDYAFRPPKMAQIMLMDISAGGALVRLSASQVAALDKRYAVGERYFLMTAMKNLKDDGLLTIFYAAICRRTFVRKDSGHIELGLQFTHWSGAANLTAPLQWQPVEEDGEVPPLLRWTSRAAARMKRAVG